MNNAPTFRSILAVSTRRPTRKGALLTAYDRAGLRQYSGVRGLVPTPIGPQDIGIIRIISYAMRED